MTAADLDQRSGLLAVLEAVAGGPSSESLEIDPREPLPDVEPGSIGRVVLTAPVDEVAADLATLRQIRRWLRPDGTVVCAFRNAASVDALVQVLRSDLQRAPGAVIPPEADHLHGYASAIKLLLEAGLSPDLVEVIDGERDPLLLEAARPLLEHLRVDVERAARHLSATHLVFVGHPIDGADRTDAPAMTFVACVNDEAQLANNLAASPCLSADAGHELLLYRGAGSAAEALNRGRREARHELVVFVQQDVYLPSWWPARLAAQWAKATASGPGVPAIAGAFGVRYREGGREHVGHAIDRDTRLHTGHELPADVDGLDELLLVVQRDVEQRFEPALGWHLYGTDFVLQAHAAGRRAVVLDIPCHHNSLLAELGGAYHHAESVLAGKWPHELPIVTNSSTIDHDPRDRRMADLEEALHGAWAGSEELQEHLAATRDLLASREVELSELRGDRLVRFVRRLRGRSTD